MTETDVGAVYRRVADDHRQAIEQARRIVVSAPFASSFRVARALVAIDEAMRAELTDDPMQRGIKEP